MEAWDEYYSMKIIRVLPSMVKGNSNYLIINPLISIGIYHSFSINILMQKALQLFAFSACVGNYYPNIWASCNYNKYIFLEEKTIFSNRECSWSTYISSYIFEYSFNYLGQIWIWTCKISSYS